MSERSADGMLQEGTFLLIAGLLLPVAIFGNLFLGPVVDSTALTIAMALWIVWFGKWAVAGGMPRLH